jgi:hypothetical protein
VGWWLALPDLAARQDLTGWHKVASYFIVLFVPLAGAAAYYVFRPVLRSAPEERDDPYTREQLAVLTQLRRAGVLTPAEYGQESAALNQMAAVESSLGLEQPQAR